MELAVSHGFFSYASNHPLLEDVNFSLNCSTILSILGRNGAGKTTLLKCLLGFERWNSGATLIDGADIRSIAARDFWSRIGYVAQAKNSMLSFTVRDMVVLGRSVRLGTFARPGKKDWEKVNEALEAVGISHLANARCDEISGGQYQLALVARALAGEPQLLVLDEPESNLDYKNQLQVLKVLHRLKTDLGIGAVINTHFPSHAIELSDHALVMLPGCKTIFGPAKDVISEENLTQSFGIQVKVLHENLKERPNYASVIAVPENTNSSQ